jgi:tetratricopeptide (TPR) repeat protein
MMISKKIDVITGLVFFAIVGFRCGAVNETQKAFETKDYRKTLALSKQAVRADSTDSSGWMWMARAYVGLDSLDKADGSLEKALRLRPSDETLTAEAVRIFLQIGDCFRGKADNNQTRQYYEKAAKLDPSSVDVLSRLADMDEQAGRLEDAQRRYETLIEVSSDPTLYVSRVNVLESKIRFAEESFQEGMTAYRNKEYERAESCFSKTLEAYPAKPDAAYYLYLSEGKRLYKKATPKARKAARDAFQKAGASNPKAAEPHFWTARLWEMEDKNDLLKNAIEEYETALRLEPDGPLAGQCLEKVRTLKIKKEKMDEFWSRGKK